MGTARERPSAHATNGRETRRKADWWVAGETVNVKALVNGRKARIVRRECARNRCAGDTEWARARARRVHYESTAANQFHRSGGGILRNRTATAPDGRRRRRRRPYRQPRRRRPWPSQRSGFRAKDAARSERARTSYSRRRRVISERTAPKSFDVLRRLEFLRLVEASRVPSAC